MNCQDISRIANTGSFDTLTAAERRAAEEHARTCRHCLPTWAVHSRLAELRVPPTPAELLAWSRKAVARPASISGRRALRRLIVIGGMVALAAAAAMLALQLGDGRARAPRQSILAVAPASRPPPLPTAQVLAVAPAGEAAAMTKGREARKPRSVAPLPLLPMPVYDGEAQQEALLELALEKAADQHPELVEGPDIDDTFALGATIRQDGTLLGSTVKLATRAELRDATAEVRREMPADGAGGSGGGRSKHSLLQDGRMLRADISFWVAIVPNNYDITRSNVRVLQILGDRHADLMLPATGGEMNRLTVLLSDDGHVQREKVDRLDPQTQSGKTLLGGDSNDVAFLAQDIADRLEVDVSQIGLMGITNMEKGSRVLIMDANGGVRPDDRRQVLIVYYAWLRRAGEAGPAWGQNSSTAGRSSLDESAALRIVEQMIPDAFTLKDPAAGEPTVVLTAKGEVIRAGRVNFRKNGGGAMDAILQQQLVPGVRTSSYSMVRLRNHLDETADVNFAWEVPAH